MMMTKMTVMMTRMSGIHIAMTIMTMMMTIRACGGSGRDMAAGFSPSRSV
jgi:hypothetical protein